MIFTLAENKIYKEKFLERISFLASSSLQSGFILINDFTILEILNDILSADESLFIGNGNTVYFERDLFSAILSKNQEVEIKQILAFKRLNLEPFCNFSAELAITCQLPYSSLLNKNESQIFFIQVYKAFQLIEYSKTNFSFQNLIKLFLEKFNFKSTNQYFYYILIFMLEYVNRIKGDVFIPDRNIEKHNELPKFLSKYSEIELGDLSDFKNLRRNPIFKTKDNHLIILNPIFILDKIYNCFYFEMNKINEDREFEPNFIKEFRSSFWCKKFIEEYLFFNLIKEIFTKTEIHFSENHFDQKVFIDNKFRPDYIIKDEKNYYIFELKDALIRADTKNSYDFNKIKSEFRLKFIESDRKKKKGILQLVNCIEKIFSELELASCLEFEDNNGIYPILVLNDECFRTMGVNYLLNNWFIEELSKIDLPIEFRSRIQSLTIVLIDDLILMKILGLENERGFREIIKKYAETFTIQNEFNMFNATNFSNLLDESSNKKELNINELTHIMNELTKKI